MLTSTVGMDVVESMVGSAEGLAVGSRDGMRVVDIVGSELVGSAVVGSEVLGSAVGNCVGFVVGISVGVGVGKVDGMSVGAAVGSEEGEEDGSVVGDKVGSFTVMKENDKIWRYRGREYSEYHCSSTETELK